MTYCTPEINGERANNEPATKSLSNLLRSKGLAIFLALSTPPAMLGLTGCSRPDNDGAKPVKPEFSSLVVSGQSSGIPIEKVPERLLSLGELHGPVQDALVATIAFSEIVGLGDPAAVNGDTPAVVKLKNALHDAHRSLSNARNDSNFSSIHGQIQDVSAAVAELMASVSSQWHFDTFWNRSSVNQDGQMHGVPYALKAQVAMEKMVGALDEDMASLVPGFQLSRVIHFSRTLGAAKGVVEEVGDALKDVERDTEQLPELKRRLGHSIDAVNTTAQEPEVGKLATGIPGVIKTMTALYTALAHDLSPERLATLQERASAAINQLQLVEGEVKRDLQERHYTGSGTIYSPHVHHWFYTGAMSPYGSGGGASGFSSASRFSSSQFYAGGEAAHPSAPPGRGFQGATSTAGFKGGAFARSVPTSGVKAGGFGGTGASFGARGIG